VKTLTQSNGKILDEKMIRNVLLLLVTLSMAITVGVINKQFGLNVNVDQVQSLADKLGISVQEVNASLYQTFDDVFHTLQKPCSYIISMMSNYTLEQNGTTGNLADWNLNASQIFNSVTANLTNGGLVFVRNAIYNISSTIVINQNNGGVVLEGEGISTILRAGDNINLINITGTGAWYDTVKNMQLDGNKANYPTGGYGVYISITFSGTDAHTRLEDLFINRTHSAGVYINNGRECELTRVTVTQTDQYGLYFGGTGSDHKAVACISDNNGWAGFCVLASNTQFDACKSFGSGFGGHYADEYHGANFLISSAYRCQLTNCQAQDGLSDGFLVYATYDDLFVGCQADTNGKNGTGNYGGFKFDQAATANETCTGCVAFNRAGQGNPQSYGFWLTATPTNVVLVGDVAHNNAVYGIWTQSTNNWIHSCLNDTAWIT
jgi:hypothetical protein